MSRTRALIAAAWLVFAVVNCVLVFKLDGQETIPYHLIWASFALLYGLWEWPKRLTRTVFVVITVATGIPLVLHAQSGEIGWSECSEILLMGIIITLLMWHVDRQWAAQDRLMQLRTEERRQAQQRETASRFGSHEVRTRLTIARGFAQLIADSTADPDTKADAEVVVTELDKASALATNLLTLVRVVQPSAVSLVDFDALISAVVRRWSVTADRNWIADTGVGCSAADPERLEALLDCLLENAVKFTGPGDDIAVEASFAGKTLLLKVRDTGAGIPADDLGRIFDPFETSRTAGERAGSGLGLAIVRAITEARGGSVAVNSSVGVGTCFTLTFPTQAESRVEPPVATPQVATPVAV